MSTTFTAFLTSKLVEELETVLKTAVDNTQATVETLLTGTFNTLITNVQSSIDTATVASNIASALESDISAQLSTLVQTLADNITTNDLPTIESNFVTALTSALTSDTTLSNITSSVVPSFTSALSDALSAEVPNIVTELESLIIDQAAQSLSLPTSLSDLKASIDALTSEVQTLESNVASIIPPDITVTCVSGCTASSATGNTLDKVWYVVPSGTADFTVTQQPITLHGLVLPQDPSTAISLTLTLPSGSTVSANMTAAPAWLSLCTDDDCLTKANMNWPVTFTLPVLVSEVQITNAVGLIVVRSGW